MPSFVFITSPAAPSGGKERGTIILITKILKGLIVMLELIVRCFYNFLLMFYEIPFPFEIEVFDWIPFEERIELLSLLDKWRAAIDRWDNIKKYNTFRVGAPITDERERKELFELMLKKAYREAFERRESGKAVGVLTPPGLDLTWCEQYCERKIYEARKIAGEPVFFKSGRCCFDLGLLCGYRLIPGPYPGLENYIIGAADHECAVALIRELNAGKKLSYNYGKILVKIDDSKARFLCAERRKEMFEKYDVIGPATYSEYIRAEGVFPVPGLTLTNHELLAHPDKKVNTAMSHVWSVDKAFSVSPDEAYACCL